MRLRLSLIHGLLVPFLAASCGGPNLQAKTANAIQTLLANSAEAFLLGGGAASVDLNCSGGGSFSYSPPTSINPGDTSIDLPMTFDDCIIKVCGDEITFNSEGATLLSLTGLDPSQVGDLVGGGAIVGDDQQFLEIEIISQEQGVTGFLKGKVDFAYRMRIIGSSAGLTNISIVESTRGEPLKVKGETIKATTLKTLADRC